MKAHKERVKPAKKERALLKTKLWTDDGRRSVVVRVYGDPNLVTEVATVIGDAIASETGENPSWE